MALKPISYYGQFTPTGVDQSGAKRMQALAGLAEQVGGMAEQFGIDKAEEAKIEAKEAQQIASKEATKLTAAQLAYRKTDGIEQIEQIAIDFAEDPDGYTDAIKVYRDSAIASAPPDLRPNLALAFAPRIASNYATINSAFLKKSEKESNKSLDDSISASTVDLEKYVRSGNSDGVAQNLPDAIAMINARGENDPLYNEAEEINKLNNALYEQGALKMLDDIVETDGFVAAMTALEDFQDKPLPKGYSQDDLRAFTRSAQEDLSRQKARLNAASTQISKEATKAVNNFTDAIGLGFSVSPEEVSRVQGLVTTPEQQDKINVAQGIAAFSVMSAESRKQIIANSQTGQLSDVQTYKQMIAKNDSLTALAKKDGYALGVKQGLIEEVPFDISDPNSYLQREDQAQMLSDHYGVPVPPLNDGEATTLALAVNQMDASERTDLANSFSPSSNIFAQLDEKGQGLFAFASSIGDEAVMKEIFLGMDIVNEGTQGKLPEGYKDIFNDVVGNSLPAGAARQVLDAAIALEAYNKELSTPDTLKDSIQRASGGIKEINNHKVLLPRGVDKNTFEDYIDDFTPENVESFGGILNHTPEQAARAVSNGRIISLGSNRYGVMIGKDKNITATIPNNNPLLKPQPFIFSYRQPEMPKMPSINDEVSTYSVEEESAKFAKDRSATGALDKLLRMNPAVPRDF